MLVTMVISGGTFIKTLPFNISKFQEDAIFATENEKHVLVTAHTGSGKTLPAEFAIKYFTSRDKKVIYTSPIKALSNQKYEEFSRKYPEIEVGLLTGDIKHNPNADILIMTTEILQNYLFKKKNNFGELDFNIDIDNELACVIFDEVHYIDDADRGTVWEQVMIMLPNHVQFVMLSATIGQKEVFANWISNIKEREVVICHTDHRVVPLYFYDYFVVPNKYIENKRDKKWKQIFENKSNKLSLIKEPGTYYQTVLEKSKQCIDELSKDKFRVNRKFVINECLQHLRDNDMFPSLFFVFSRKQVESIAKDISVSLFLEDEKDYKAEPVIRQLLVSRVTNWKEYIELPEYSMYVDLLEKGIAIHHAGMLPIFREIIEILYDKKYIKCLIATETFAIGLNMPTRTVVFTSVYKHDGHSLRRLKSHEFIQMAGRAGRRNIDTRGNVILLSNIFEPLDSTENYQLFHSTPKVIKSKYKINFTLVLNYINHFEEREFHQFIGKSMMNMDIINEIEEAKKMIDYHTIEGNKYKNTFTCDVEQFKKYESLMLQEKVSYNKQKKIIRRQLESMKSQYKTLEKCYESQYLPYLSHMSLVKENEDYKYYAETYIESQIQSIYKILQERQFIDETKQLTTKGKIACNIHEMNNLVFAELYDKTDGFKSHSESDILQIISCFYDIKVNDDYKNLVAPYMQKEIKYIQEMMDLFIDYEAKYQLSSSNNYVLQFDMMKYTKKWYESVESIDDTKFFFHELKKEKDIFIGDFIKCCLKILNMCKEIVFVCELVSNYELMEKIKNISQNIHKFIVSNDSMYV